jgi:3'-phosphoadenosine 5'-phosphosulfate sulfotransferase (PAPS reductase)/FAD synthetase
MVGILREVAASFERPALLFSGGKDSCVVLRLAEKAFKNHVSGQDFKLASCPSRCCTWTPGTTSPK